LRAPPIFALVAGLAGCSAPDDDLLALAFDPCETVVLDATGATAAQRESIADAVAMWQARGASGLVLDEGGTFPGRRVSVLFEEAGAALHGYYDPDAAIVYVNAGIDDARARAVVIGHELGHAFGLYHVSAAERVSVMNPNNLSTEPNAGDEAHLASVWGRCWSVSR